nr:proteasome subunit alpha type-6 [Tanacetum cinerariifolium]
MRPTISFDHLIQAVYELHGFQEQHVDPQLLPEQEELAALEYAFKAVKAAGVTSIGVRGQAFGFNQCYTSVRVTKFVGLLATGTTVFMTILSDARTLVQQARNEAAEFQFKYGYEMHVEVLARTFMFQVC